MSGRKQNMEELFSSQFEGYLVEPSPGMWSRIRSQLFWKEFFHFSLNTLNIYYTAIVAAALVGGTLLVLNNTDKKHSRDTDVAVSGQEMPVEPGMDIQSEQPSYEFGDDVEEMDAEAEMTEADPDRNRPVVTTVETTTGSEKEQATKLQQGATGTVKDAGAMEQSDLKTAENVTVAVGFEASKYQGCAPLAVEFNNRSKNAAGYAWNFGDGGRSDLENPSYVFDQPGEYTVQLKVKGLDGKVYATTRKIDVFITPKAQFEYDENAPLASGQPVYFYNYSRDADYFSWNFGDGERSGQSDPSHYYANPGEYNVTLKVWTTNRCYDSVTVLNAFALAENNILFPNAFTPNTSGPVGGYYTPGDPKNEVFYPVIRGEVLEYELKIYNRIGQLIFETNDINYGWDGYYQDQLSGQGVYIWKVRGRYSNGKTFVRSGDVTLIWK